MLGGAPTDNNAKILREGQMKVLQPAIDKGDIKIVGQQWVKEWNPTEALSIVENALTRNDNKIDGIVASNDATAGGAIQALAAQQMAGKVPISGQDADLAAVKRVIAGTQTMTVYKPLKLIATEAAKLSVQLARNEKPTYSSQYDNGSKSRHHPAHANAVDQGQHRFAGTGRLLHQGANCREVISGNAKTLVGASLLAKTAAHSVLMPAEPPLSRAGSLPQS
ncbi:substrate-binding domain-containing protein [Pseudomonas sp. H22_DOA]|nr:substrate-binding domain-containing protein [Pseudomonas sp. H22_DOA]